MSEVPAESREPVPGRARTAPDAVDRAMAEIMEAVRPCAPLGVAYSGGVDSATLLALAARALGPQGVVAILGVSPSLAARERRSAHATAAAIGVRVVEVRTFEGEVPAYRANGPDRCFHCKDELFSRIDDELVAELGLAAVAFGENADDAGRPDRPGARAATAHRILRPLADAGAGKQTVREMARRLGLDVAQKPAAPCLASRVPHFEEVTPAKLAQIDVAEEGLHSLGLAECRVRHHGEVARIEVPAGHLVLVAERAREVRRAVRAAGFRFVALDLGGLQPGAFTLPLVEIAHGGSGRA